MAARDEVTVCRVSDTRGVIAHWIQNSKVVGSNPLMDTRGTAAVQFPTSTEFTHDYSRSV